MWQRFTERARKIVFYAQEEAQNYGSAYVSTEHLLLGLLREPESVACVLLARLGFSLSEIADAMIRNIVREDKRPSQDMTLTPRAKRVIDLAYDEARNLSNNYIGTEHLLLGLVREGDGLAGRVLAKAGVELEPLRKAVLTVQKEISGEAKEAESAAQHARPTHIESVRQILDARRGRMPGDYLCLTFLADQLGSAANALRGCHASVTRVMTAIEDAILAPRKAEPAAEAPFVAEGLLTLASAEARDLDQPINGAHFLLAALAHAENATARALIDAGLNYDKLRAFVVDNG